MSWGVDSVQCSACALYLLMLFQGPCATILLLEGRERAKLSIISVVLASPFEVPLCLHYSLDATDTFQQVSPFNATSPGCSGSSWSPGFSMLMLQEHMNSCKVSLGGLDRVKFHYSDFASSG